MKTLLIALCCASLFAQQGPISTVGSIPVPFFYNLQSSVTRTATYSGTPASSTSTPNPIVMGKDLIVTLNVTAADAGGTYDVYVTTCDGLSCWDVVHFPQIANATGRYTALVSGSVFPQNVTTASPGVLATTSGTLKTDTVGAGNGLRTLAAGIVRHGPWGRTLGHEVVAGGSVTTGVTYSITVTVK